MMHSRPSSLETYLELIVGCSIADAILTYDGIRRGMLVEANPIWIYILSVSPVLFFVLKVLLTIACCWLIWSAGAHKPRMALHAAQFCFIAYIVVGFMHAVGRIAASCL